MDGARSPRAGAGRGAWQSCRCSNRGMLATLVFVMALAAFILHEVRGHVLELLRFWLTD